MEKKDYIIVGLGIAGITICEQLRKNNKSFVVFDSNRSATKIAGGTIHPCVLKYFTLVWNGASFFQHAHPFYKEMESFLNSNFISETPILKIFASIEEQNLWNVASDKKELATYLNDHIIANTNQAINAQFGFGKVNHSFQANTKILLQNYQKYLLDLGLLKFSNFEYDRLSINSNEIKYKDISASKIIFSEGPSALNNPWFPKTVLIPKKGEYITIKAPKLKFHSVLKSKYFVIPQGDDTYKVGATFAHDDKELITTEKGKKELIEFLQNSIAVPFEVIDQEVGMRPTVKDRRPLLGSFSNHKNVYFFNGLGPRGLLMAPLLSQYLFDAMESNVDLPSEIDINRFAN